MSNSKKFVESAIIGKQRSIQDKEVLFNIDNLKFCDMEKYATAVLELIPFSIFVHILFSLSFSNKTSFVFIKTINFSFSAFLFSVNFKIS